jgi:hypothetical protein
MGPVTRQYLGIVRESQQARLDRVDDLLEVAPREIGAPDAAGKERVAGNEQLERRKMQAD